jgi:EmrB/QacA subfamily drug resistance transporter
MSQLDQLQALAAELPDSQGSRLPTAARPRLKRVSGAGQKSRAERMNRKPLILVSLLLAAFVINLDTTIVNVALPSLVRQLHATTSQLQWVVDAFNLFFAGSVLAAGSLSDRLGRKGMLLAGLVVFGLASLAGGLMASTGQLIAARAVMGVGAAMVFPATLSLLTNVFTEPGERALAIGLWGAVTGAAIAQGPIVGGWLLEVFDWRSIFIAMTPIAAIAGFLTARYVPTSAEANAPRSDRVGFALSSAAIGLLIYTFIEAPNQGWASPRTLAGFTVAVLLAAAFVVWERHVEHPMLDVTLFANPRFTAASASVAISFFALSGFIFLVTQYVQFIKNYSPLSTGVRLLPVASCVAVSSIIGTKLALRFGTKLIVATGLAAMAAFYLWVTTVAANTSYWTIAAQMVVLGTGMGLTSAPATEAIMAVVPKAKAGIGSAVNDATRLLGGTLGVAVIGSVYASLYASRLTTTLPAGLPKHVARTAHASIGGALSVAGSLAHSGHPAIAAAIHKAASSAFFNGFHAANWVAAGVAAAGAIVALVLLPAKPTDSGHDRHPSELPVPAYAAS